MALYIAINIFFCLMALTGYFIVRKKERKNSLLSLLTPQETISRKARKQHKYNIFAGLERKAAAAGVNFSLQEILVFVALGMLSIFAISYLLFGSMLMSATLAPIGLLLPNIIFKSRVKKRANLISNLLSDMLKNMANSIRAGSTVQQAFETASSKIDEPLKTVLEEVKKDIVIGESFVKALKKASEKIPLKIFDSIVLAIQLNSELGGDLAEALEELANDIEEQKFTRDILLANTAQGKWSSLVVGAMPFILIAALRLISPDYLQPMLDSTTGYFLLLLAVVFIITGLLWVRYITNFDFEMGD